MITPTRRQGLGLVGATLTGLGLGVTQPATAPVQGRDQARARTIGALEPVGLVAANYPAGIAVSRHGRIFLSCPNQDGDVVHTLYELVGDRPRPWPDDQRSRPAPERASAGALVSVQALLFDALDRLWLLDSGFRRLGLPPLKGGPKLVQVDIATGRFERRIDLGLDNGAVDTTFLNDLRIDLGRGSAGTVYITDSAQDGRNALIVVDLASGRALRRLQGRPSVRPEPGLRPIVEGEFLVTRPAGEAPRPFSGGVNGIAISPDGERVIYSAFTGRRLYDVSAAALSDPALDDEAVEATVRDLGEKGVSGGLETDAAGAVYLTCAEHNAIFKRELDGQIATIVYDSRLLWPDTLALGPDGWLYVTASQYHRRPVFQDGKDLRQPPYGVYRVQVDAWPVHLPPRTALFDNQKDR